MFHSPWRGTKRKTPWNIGRLAISLTPGRRQCNRECQPSIRNIHAYPGLNHKSPRCLPGNDVAQYFLSPRLELSLQQVRPIHRLNPCWHGQFARLARQGLPGSSTPPGLRRIRILGGLPGECRVNEPIGQMPIPILGDTQPGRAHHTGGAVANIQQGQRRRAHGDTAPNGNAQPQRPAEQCLAGA